MLLQRYGVAFQTLTWGTRDTTEERVRRYFGRAGGAGYLGISERTLDKLVADKRIPAARVGRRVVLDRQDLDEFVARLKQGA